MMLVCKSNSTDKQIQQFIYIALNLTVFCMIVCVTCFMFYWQAIKEPVSQWTNVQGHNALVSFNFNINSSWTQSEKCIKI